MRNAILILTGAKRKPYSDCTSFQKDRAMPSSSSFPGGRRRRFMTIALSTLTGVSTAMAAPPPSSLQDFDAAGPVRLARDQVAVVCASNFGGESEQVLLAFVNATPSPNFAGVLSAQQAQIAPNQTVCLYLPGANLLPLGPDASVVGMVVHGGFVNEGVIGQSSGGVGGGGCIHSVQIIDAPTGKTLLLADTLRHRVR